MKTNELFEQKINNLLKAIRKDLISKNDAYNQFIGYVKAFTELGIITPAEAADYKLQLAKVLF